MKIVLLDGGLTNQLTQYIFARCLEENTKDKNELILLDDLWFFCQHPLTGDKLIDKRVSEIENHDYQLNKFPNLKHIQLASEYFDSDVWEEIIVEANKRPPLRGGTHLPQILKDNGLDFFMIAEAPIYQFDGKVARMPYYYYMPEMLNSQGNCYYFGWFTNGGWFMSHEQMFRKELTLPPLWKKYDIEMLNLIHDSLSISVHIRRGAYAYIKMTDCAYFKNALQAVYKHISENKKSKTPRIFVFSDEIEWIKEHADDYGLANSPYEVIYSVENRSRDENQCDLQLMSECDIMILELSSVYSYMAALLNNKKDKIVINPNKSRGVF